MRLISGAAAREEQCARELVRNLYPIVVGRVARVLRRKILGRPHEIRDRSADLAQEVFAVLFREDARRLCAWKPDRGLSLPNYVGMIAEHTVIDLLRRKSGRSSEELVSDSVLDARIEPDGGPELTALSRERLVIVLDRLRSRLTAQGYEMFELIYVEERNVADIAGALRMSEEAVYAWRSRIRKIAAEIAAELQSATPTPAPSAVLKEHHG